VRRTIVTGAASGIGRETARLFASRGWTVGLLDRDAAGLERLQRELGAANTASLVADVCDPEAVRQAMHGFCGGPAGQLQLLVNNAGVLFTGPFEEIPPHAHRQLIEVNARGVVECLLAGFPMLRNGRGRVVNIASASANFGTPDFATYSATKMFVRGLSEALDIEWRRHGIRVACIMPAFVDTPMIATRRTAALDRLGVQLQPEDVAATVWRAAHGRRLMWQVGRRYRLIRVLSQPLPGVLRRGMMRWISGY
jgi:short-subunit dehydrogenase